MSNPLQRFAPTRDLFPAGVIQTLEARENALRARELAKLLGVSRQHIYKMAAGEGLPFFRMGRAVRFDPKQVAGWLVKKMPHTGASASLRKIAV
jgi:excisionase family DNA binding protein